MNNKKNSLTDKPVLRIGSNIKPLSVFLLSRLLLVACFSIFILTTSCSFEKRKIRESIVIKVNSSQLTLFDFAQMLAHELKDFDLVTLKGTNYFELTKNRIIKEFIVHSLASEWAQKNNIIITPDEVEKEMKTFLGQFPDEYSFRATLLKEKISFEEWKNKIKGLILQKKVQNKLFEDHSKITEEDLLSYYKNNRSNFEQPNTIKLQQIVLSTRSDAERIYKEIKKGADFTDYAKKYSITPEGTELGGNLGWISPGGIDVFEFLFVKNKGYISNVRQSEFGFHIMKIVDKKRRQTLSFKEARNEIFELLKRQKMQAIFVSWLEGETRKAKIFKSEELISSVKLETLGNQL